jgi:acetoin utilization protein AcuC
MARYRFGDDHPMRPERFTLAVDLMRDWGLVDEGPPERVVEDRALRLTPSPAGEEDHILVHSPSYVAFVAAASSSPSRASGHGIGQGDTPAFLGMHEASALIVGGTMLAVDSVLDGRARRAFAPAGGLHHAQHDRASGFCVYNDVAIGIERATRRHAGLRVAYVDIDAHHGDGVESFFYERSDVLTLSVHESGRYLFPGSGRATDTGQGAGEGYALNVPLPPDAGPESYGLVLAEVIDPALRSFSPDLIVAQAGGDTHFGDPLTHLRQTISGFYALIEGILCLADELTDGRVVLTGGGGYQPFSVVPRMWAGALALLLDISVPAQLPEAWVTRANELAVAAGREPTQDRGTWSEDVPDFGEQARATAMQATRHAVDSARAASALLRTRI